MKKSIMVFAVCIMALPAMAVLTLPIAEDATSQAGEMRVSAGVTIESDLNMYGGRFTYGISDELSVFVGAGLADPDDIDSEPYFQVGGKFMLPVDMPFDLALRAGFGLVSFDDKESYSDEWGTESWKAELDVWMLNAGLLASKEIDEMITIYGFGGISYQSMKIKVSGSYSDIWGNRESVSGSDTETETELAIAGGVLFSMNENVSFYGEIAHIDETFISAGARFRF